METDLRKYQKHKSTAKVRGIDFNLTFDEWLNIWQNSGHYQDRGRGKGKYVMSRIDDKGGYTLGNVFIQLNKDNVIDACKGNDWNKGRIHTEKTKKKISQGLKGRILSQEWKDKIKAAGIGKKKPPTIITCKHCGKQGAMNNINRWHNNNCKLKEFYND